MLLWKLLLVFLINSVSCSYDCFDNVHRGDFGTISVNDYSRDTSCYQEIRLNDQTNWIKLTWVTFNVDGDMPYCKDYVQVFTGCGIYQKLVAKFCSNNLVSSKPHDIYSPTGCMKLKLVAASSTSKSNLGFSASYISGSRSVDPYYRYCSTNSRNYGSSGVITTPNWPQDFSYNMIGTTYNRECDWDISRSSNEQIQLNFMDFDVGVYSSRYCSTSYSKAYVEVEEKKPSSLSSERKYCGTLSPFTRNTRSYRLQIELKVESGFTSSSNRGMAIGWVAYRQNSNVGGSTQSPIIIGIVACVMVVILIIGIVACVKCKQKRPRQVTANAVVVNHSTTSLSHHGSVHDYHMHEQPYLVPPGYVVEDKPYLGAPPPYSDVGYPPSSGYPELTHEAGGMVFHSNEGCQSQETQDDGGADE